MAEIRKIGGDTTGDPVEVRQTGCLSYFAAFGFMLLVASVGAIVSEIQDANKLKKTELDIQKQRLELAKKQYMLDSLRFYSDIKKR